MATPEETAQAAAQAIRDIEQAAEASIAKLLNIDVGVVFKNMSSFFSKFNDNIKESSNSLDNMAKPIDNIYNGFTKVFTLLSGFQGFKNFSVQGGAHLNSMGAQFDVLAARMGSFEKLASALGPAFATKFAQVGAEGMRRFLSQVEQAQKLESGFLDLAAATGQLGDVYHRAGENLGDLDQMTRNFSTHLSRTGDIMGIGQAEMAQFAATTKDIPGLFDQMVRRIDKAGADVDGLTATLKLAAGAHVDVAEAVNAMKVAYEDLGNPQGTVEDNVTKGAKLFALMTQASQDLNIRFADTKGFLTQVADTFKNVGDNTEGATRVLGKYISALRETGLTTKSSVSLIQDMVGAISRLEIGTKALISSRTGGPGGLQGAFKIDQLIRQGKTDEVVAMIDKTLRQQFRGKIYTQEEAANSPQAAAGFMRQREILKSGAFGSLAKDDATATHLLEAMSKGDMSAGNIIKGSMEAMKDTMAQGTDITNRQLTSLNKINSSLDRIATTQQQQLMLTARNVLGTGSKDFAEKVIADNDNIQSLQNGDVGNIKTRALENVDSQDLTQNRESSRAFQFGVSSAASGVTNFVSSMVSDASQAIKEMKQGPTANTQVKKAEEGQAQTARAVARGRPLIAAAGAQAMREMPQMTAARAMPRSTESVKHEVALKPLEVNVHVKADENLKTTVSTNYDTASTTKELNQGALQGFTQR